MQQGVRYGEVGRALANVDISHLRSGSVLVNDSAMSRRCYFNRGIIMRHMSRSRWCATWFGCLGMMLSWPNQGAADKPDLVSVVREGHRAARQFIRTFSASVTDKITFEKQGITVIATAKYWRTFDTARIREKQGSATADILLKDGEIRQVGRAMEPRSKKDYYSVKRRTAVEILAQCDVWTKMLIDFPGPDGGHYDFDRSLEFAKGQPRASRVKEDGHNSIRLTMNCVSTTGIEYYVTLWHDVDRNYLVWKKTATNDRYSNRSENEILEFVEPVPGVFIPTKCSGQWFGEDGELASREEITLSDIEVNKPIPASVFQLPAIPSGTLLDDHIRGVRYPINENWQPIGPERPIPGLAVVSKSDQASSDYHSQSTSEAKPLSRLLVPVSLVILVTACICLIYRHYRSQAGYGGRMGR
jgi:hypothetical protein